MSRIPPVLPIEAEAWKSTFRGSSYVQDQISQTHKICKEALSSLEDEERQLELRQQQISQMKTQLKIRIQRLESAIAPHRKLPSEILSRIFEFAHEEELWLPEPIAPTGVPKPMVEYNPFRIKEVRSCRPGHVCLFWRQVTEQTPFVSKRIWGSVSIDYEMLAQWEGFVSPVEIADVAREIIARGTHTVYINFGAWQGIGDVVADWVPDDKLLNLTIEAGLPQLEKITIETHSTSQAFLNRCAALFSTWPRLSSITLLYYLNDGYVLFPFHQVSFQAIVELDVGNPGGIPILLSPDEFYHLLASSPQMKSCNIGISCTDRLPVRSPPECILIHRSMENLTLWRDGCQCDPTPALCRQVMAPFQYLSLPSLLNLTGKFSCSSDWHRRHSRALFDLIIRSQCRLKELNIEDSTLPFMPFSTMEWTTLIPFFVDLELLQVQRWTVQDDVLHKIAAGEWLPRLHMIMCYCSEHMANGHCKAELVELLISRPNQAYVQRYGASVHLFPLMDGKYAELQEEVEV